MLRFAFSSIYMTIIASNLLLAVIAVIMQNKKALINAGYKLIIAFLGLTVLRFLFPFELPFATNIIFPQGISIVIQKLNYDFFTICGIGINSLKIAILIWLAVFVFLLIRYVLINRVFQRNMYLNGKDVTKNGVYQKSMTEILPESFKKIRLYEIKGIQSPILYGILNPVILMPMGQTFTEKELSFILRHELSHYRHHDLLIKFGVQMLTIFYWWNPFCLPLKKQINLLLEMRIDDTVVNRGEKEVLDYLQFLLHIAEYRNPDFNGPMESSISFFHGDEQALTKRFHMLLNRDQKKHHGYNILLTILVLLIFILSYLYTFEGSYVPPEIEESSILLTDDNSYIIQNPDGTYDVYFSGIKIETLTTLEFYDDIPVYTPEEFERVQEEKQD